MAKGHVTITVLLTTLVTALLATNNPVLGPAAAAAQTIVDRWASVPAPPPVLKPVTADPKTTALLMLDLMTQNCGKRPACVASLPVMKKLLADARAAKVPVIYSIIANSTTADVMPDVAPLPDEPWVQSGPDKFLNTDLAKFLRTKAFRRSSLPEHPRTAQSSLPGPGRHSGG